MSSGSMKVSFWVFLILVRPDSIVLAYMKSQAVLIMETVCSYVPVYVKQTNKRIP